MVSGLQENTICVTLSPITPSVTPPPVAYRNVSEDVIITASLYSFFLVFQSFFPVLMHLPPHVLTTCTFSNQKSASESIQNVYHKSISHTP